MLWPSRSPDIYFLSVFDTYVTSSSTDSIMRLIIYPAVFGLIISLDNGKAEFSTEVGAQSSVIQLHSKYQAGAKGQGISPYFGFTGH